MQNLVGAKPLLIRCDKVDGFIREYDGTYIQFSIIMLQKM